MLSRLFLLALAAVAAVAGAAHAAGADLDLKCKAVQLYLNATGAFEPLPCDVLLKEVKVVNSSKVVLPVIVVGELRKANIDGTRQAFDALKRARMAGFANLDGYVEKMRLALLKEINATDLDSAYKAVSRAALELELLRALLWRSGVHPTLAVVEADLRNLDSARQLLWALRLGDMWAVMAVGNASDLEIGRALRRVAVLRAEWGRVLNWLERLNIAWHGQARVAAERWLASVNSTLIDIWIAAKVDYNAVVKHLRDGDLAAIRAIAKRAKKERAELAEVIMRIAREITSGIPAE